MSHPKIFTGGMAMTNGYLLETRAGHLLIDAPEGIIGWLQELEVKPVAMLLTHQHFDHVEDAGAIQAWAGCPVHAFSPFDDALTLGPILRSLGMEVKVAPYAVDHVLKDKTTLSVLDLDCRLFSIPGHSPDSLAFYFPALNMVFSGDTLMAGGVGRTDFPGGSLDQLISGIRTHLLSLPRETMIFSGHGESTSISEELATNPYLC